MLGLLLIQLKFFECFGYFLFLEEVFEHLFQLPKVVDSSFGIPPSYFDNLHPFFYFLFEDS